ncbi:HlyD family efflux transporter periplasmic adaptor subunit [Dyadobacter sp. 676]|uniref:HlyD family efflux transporter periplasmic adaptor subunit n=1 Tax=Dyadobacter sp. 676 TaxID=3088362 RepID=A0AAU8FLE0_9BACT
MAYQLWIGSFPIFFTCCIALTCWIQYPDVVTASFILTTKDPPRSMVATVNGKLIKINNLNGDVVAKGGIVAMLESPADYKQVLALETFTAQAEQWVHHDKWDELDKLDLHQFSQLGELETPFQDFFSQLEELQSSLGKNFYLQRRRLLQNDIDALANLEDNLRQQMQLTERQLDLARDDHEIQKKLFEQKTISKLEYGREKAKLVEKELPLAITKSAFIENSVRQTSKKAEMISLDNTVLIYKNKVKKSLRTLTTSLRAWKIKYLITAPVSGTLSYKIPLQEQMQVASGDQLFDIEPKTENYQGIIQIKQFNQGKLQEGQRVFVRLDGFQYREYGLLQGKLGSISATADKQDIYWGFVDLPSKLNTTYGKKLKYRSGLRGTAEIITDDKKLIWRLIEIFQSGK